MWTSDLPAAGTKAPVTVCMRGDKATGEPILLDNDPNNFTRGRHDSFEVLSAPLGPLRRVRCHSQEKNNDRMTPTLH